MMYTQITNLADILFFYAQKKHLDSKRLHNFHFLYKITSRLQFKQDFHVAYF